MDEHPGSPTCKIDGRAAVVARLIGAPNIEHRVGRVNEAACGMNFKVQPRVVGGRDAAQCTGIEGGCIGGGLCFLIGPFKARNVGEILVTTGAESLPQEAGKGGADVLPVASARGVRSLEIKCQPAEIFAAHEALDDRVFEREGLKEACAQMIPVDAEPEAAVDAIVADVGTIRRSR